MSVTVRLTYDMSKEVGERRIELEGVSNVNDVLRLTRERFGDAGASFDTLSRVAGLAVNGVLVNHRQGLKTPVRDGDSVAFVKAAAGG